ncbi:hypothetical protein C5167_020536 [Papaver somniferum]|uniref:Uncharacterized protein n=1 Tax=Papaver somniferum TaxID=3469 RepID=A0A4Y7IWF0_PAPSO|nr:hypothetical protein C5167_020536 [Papaver somniferum]
MSFYPDARLPEESVYHNVETTRGRNVIFDIPGSSNIGCGAATSDNPVIAPTTNGSGKQHGAGQIYLHFPFVIKIRNSLVSQLSGWFINKASNAGAPDGMLGEIRGEIPGTTYGKEEGRFQENRKGITAEVPWGFCDIKHGGLTKVES